MRYAPFQLYTVVGQDFWVRLNPFAERTRCHLSLLQGSRGGLDEDHPGTNQVAVYGWALYQSQECKECGCQCEFVSPGTNCLDVWCDLSCGVVESRCVNLDNQCNKANMSFVDGFCGCKDGFFNCDNDLRNGCESTVKCGGRCGLCDEPICRFVAEGERCSRQAFPDILCYEKKGLCIQEDVVCVETSGSLDELRSWYRKYKSGEFDRLADFDCNGEVEVRDLIKWYGVYRNNKSLPTSTITPVPSPTSTQIPTQTVPLATPTQPCKGDYQKCDSDSECCSSFCNNLESRHCDNRTNPLPTLAPP